VFLLAGLVSCEIVLLSLNVIFTSVCLQTIKQLANTKLHTQFFTTFRLVQFSATKSPPFNVTSLITVQLACNNNEVVNTSHPILIRRLPINRFLLVTQSEYHAQYIHPLFNNSIHIAHLTQLNSSQRFSNIPTPLKQFRSSRF